MGKFGFSEVWFGAEGQCRCLEQAVRTARGLASWLRHRKPRCKDARTEPKMGPVYTAEIIGRLQNVNKAVMV